MRSSAEQVPSLHRDALRYLKLVTSANWNWSPLLILISALMLFVLLVMILLFSVLTFFPYVVALSMTMLVRSWRAAAHRIDAFGNHRLQMGLPPMEIAVWWSWSVSCMIFSRKKLNSMGESEHPCGTPTVVLKNSHSWLFKRTALLEFSCSIWTA